MQLGIEAHLETLDHLHAELDTSRAEKSNLSESLSNVKGQYTITHQELVATQSNLRSAQQELEGRKTKFAAKAKKEGGDDPETRGSSQKIELGTGKISAEAV